ncbi:McrC family protein [Saccharopolyspora cebuensis]|uniref:McrC family protein n=1 Tax=Saccharopolyspora cebuensis TaxID=418759 RepID=A0ABV4CJM9_9PSEU
MTSLVVPETGSVVHTLTAAEARDLAQSGIVKVGPLLSEPGWWTVSARGKVGAARVGAIELVIEPKLPIERLLFLLGYATDPTGWRDDDVHLGTASGLVPAVAQALWRQCEKALRPGPMQGYRTVDESSHVLRGRLRERDQLRRHHGRPLPLEVRRDDFSIDVPENRILLAAITRMLTVPGIDTGSRCRLAALRGRLVGVTPLPPGSRLPTWFPNRLNERYHLALRMAEIVWKVTSPEHTEGTTVTTGFLFDLAKVFEDFVTTAVGETLHSRHGGAARPQYPCHFDEACTVRMRPDLVWQHEGRPALVLDAKYKKDSPNEDLYQVLAYCTVFQLHQGHLVYARGDAEPRRHTVRHGGTNITCHALDLERQPGELLSQVESLVAEMTAEAGVNTSSSSVTAG